MTGRVEELDGTSGLAEARRALGEQDWVRAHRLLSALVGPETEDPEVLAEHAEAAWWLGNLVECIHSRERAYIRYESAGEHRRAAHLAARLFDDHCFQGRPIVGRTWVRRAARLLGADQACVARGCLLLREVEVASSSGDLALARELAERALEIGRELADPDLEAESMQALGRILVTEGSVRPGVELYDEAMLLATSGRLSPFVTGKVYCSLISACEELGDVGRAAEWTEITTQWSAGHPFAVFPGLCRVHRAHMLQFLGRWDQAVAEAGTAWDELDGLFAGSAARALYEIGDIHRRLGRLDEADEAFRRVAGLGGRNQPGLALLKLARGQVVSAAAGIAQALDGERANRLSRAPLLRAQVEIALAAGDPDAAREAAEELEGIATDFPGPMSRAAAWTARGQVHLADGEAAAACRVLRRALAEWAELSAAYEVASTRTLLGNACRLAGDTEAAAACLAAAAEELDRLGIHTGGVRRERDGLPDGLTEREAEVLRLVAAGGSNKHVAAALTLSQKTVARHLSNIFTKTGVASRSAATAYAFRNGLIEG